MPTDLSGLDCTTTARGFAAGEFTATERVRAALETIDEADAKLGAFLLVDADGALERAAALDADPEARSLPLAAVPIALKDNLCVRGMRTTAGSKILGRYTPPYSATVVERLRAAGAVVLGKTNMDEFAMGSSTENSALGRTVNPHDPTRVPGGSSGGSAAAVAAGMVAAALGSDTGGSVRQPAAFCGVAGLKPTYGRVSRYGLIAFASSLDQIGPLTRSVGDAALMLEAMAGDDALDATTIDVPVPPYADELDCEPSDLRVGVAESWLAEGLDPEVRAVLDDIVTRLEGAGAHVRTVQLPHQRYAIATYYVVATAEASSNLARYDGVRYGLRVDSDDLEEMIAASRSAGFGAEVKRRILLGTYVLSAGYYDAYYGRAQRVRTLIRGDFDRAFEQVDVLLGPTTPTTAFPLGDKTDDPLAMYLSDVYTVTANLAGLPAISVPAGVDERSLPVGLQIVGPAFGETRVLQAAALLESLLDASAAEA